MDRKHAIAALKKLWSTAVKIRDKHVCQIELDGHRCTQPGTDPHHWFKCRHMGVKFLLLNGITVCRGHHDFLEAHPEINKQLCKSRVGEEDYATLEHLAKSTVKLDTFELIQIVKAMRKALYGS